jgi:hypothetical protein
MKYLKYSRRPIVRLVPAAALSLLALPATGGAAAAAEGNFRAHLRGSNEIPAVDTNAQGQAIFHVSEDGSSIHFKLIAANIENVLVAHIHLAPEGVNGPVVVFLFHGPLIPGRFQGILAEGTFTAADLIGPLKGKPLGDLIDAMEAGNTYANIHTTAHPGGEIRGQIH